MVTHLIVLIIGMMAGATIGYFTAALMFAAAQSDQRAERALTDLTDLDDLDDLDELPWEDLT